MSQEDFAIAITQLDKRLSVIEKSLNISQSLIENQSYELTTKDKSPLTATRLKNKKNFKYLYLVDLFDDIERYRVTKENKTKIWYKKTYVKMNIIA